MKRIKLISNLFFLLVSSTVFGQKQIQKGWVVTNTGDTLKGDIVMSDWGRNPEKITFKTTSEKKYEVADLQAFGVDGENLLYKRYTIEKHLTPVSEYDEIPSDENKTESITAWLNILVQGKISLGHYMNSERSYFYYIRDNQPVELIYSKGIKKFNGEKDKNDSRYGSSSVTENLEYKKQLWNLNIAEKDMGDISEQLNRTGYNVYELTNVFSKLNNVAVKKTAKGGGTFFVGLGVAAFSTTVTGSGTLLDNSSEIKSATSPLIKFGYLIKSSSPYARLSFMVEGALLFYNTTGTKKTVTSNGIKYDFKNTFAGAGLSVKYTLNPLARTRVSLNAGVLGLINVSKKNQTSEESLSGSVSVYPNTPKFKNVVASPAVGAMVSLSKFDLFADYRFGSNMTEYINTNYKVNILSVGVAYRFR